MTTPLRQNLMECLQLHRPCGSPLEMYVLSRVRRLAIGWLPRSDNKQDLSKILVKSWTYRNKMLGKIKLKQKGAVSKGKETAPSQIKEAVIQ